jgi:hypothetical protein
MTATGAGGGFTANSDQIMTCASRLSQLEQDAAEIARLARQANPDVMALGALGEVVSLAFRDATDRIHQHLDEMHKGLAQHAQAMDCTGCTYDAVEQHHVTAIQHFTRQNVEGGVGGAR